MDAQLKAKWVEALRSGDYQQGMNYLRRGNSFCCLGVLCDISQRGDWTRDEEDPVPGTMKYKVGNNASCQYLSWALRNDYGLDGFFLEEVMKRNDEGDKFSAIADYIEARL